MAFERNEDNRLKLHSLLSAGRIREVAETAYALSQNDSADDAVKKFGAAAAYEVGLDDIAIQLFTGVSDTQALRADQWAMLGHAAERQASNKLAIRAYNEALRIDPVFTVARYNLGSMYLWRHQWDLAIWHLREACNLLPDFEAAHQNLIRAYIGAEFYVACFEHISTCQAAFPESQEYLYLRAEAYLREGMLEKAKEDYDTLLDSDPSNEAAWSGYLSTLSQANEFDLALELIESGRTKGIPSTVLDEAEASILLESGESEKAAGMLWSLMNVDPMNRGVRVNLIDALIQMDKADTAISICDEKLSFRPGDPEALAYKGIALLHKQDYSNFEQLAPVDLISEQLIRAADGYANMSAFNDALSNHVLNHPTLNFSPPTHATINGRHTGSLLLEPQGPVTGFLKLIENAQEQYFENIVDIENPAFARRTDDYTIAIWSVEMKKGGHQAPHIHPSAFLSGVYYPKVPKCVDRNKSDDGCIEFFYPPVHFDVDAGPVSKTFEPAEGLLLLFPSCYFHRTLPFTSDETRISIAFDFVPQ